MKSLKSLIITTSNNALDNNAFKTGVWMETLAAPYYILRDAGEYITIVSPKGGKIPLDQNSKAATAVTKDTERFEQDHQAMYHFSHTLPLNEVKPEEYDLVFVAGGYGAMWDFPANKELKLILEYFIENNKPIALVGHAVAALLPLKNKDGIDFIKGKKLTAFSNSEEAHTGLNESPPFLLESTLSLLGALYSRGQNFKSYVVTDGNIITGQNPASAVDTAKQLLALAHKKYKDATVY